MSADARVRCQPVAAGRPSGGFERRSADCFPSPSAPFLASSHCATWRLNNTPNPPPSSPMSSPESSIVPQAIVRGRQKAVPANTGNRVRYRACLLCSYIQTSPQWMQNGCPNCDEVLNVRDESVMNRGVRRGADSERNPRSSRATRTGYESAQACGTTGSLRCSSRTRAGSGDGSG